VLVKKYVDWKWYKTQVDEVVSEKCLWGWYRKGKDIHDSLSWNAVYS